jgi:chaperonin GroEL
LESITLEQLGRVKKVIIKKEETTLVEGLGDKNKIKDRIELIKRQIEESTSDYDKEKLQERLAKLTGGVAVVQVGAFTEIAQKEKKDRVDDALQATKAAVEEGIIPGGGTAFIRCLDDLKKLKEKLPQEEQIGVDIIMKAITYPLRQIVQNAGKEGPIVVQKVSEMEQNMGYDAKTDSFVNMFEKGIVDPTKVVRCSIQFASSIVTLLLTTEAIITEEEEEKEAMPATPQMPY